ncbi:MAG: T9SS type A sorting domain-containing protein [Bacteroidales bacterium]|nr:T9SS type A sorting domain-containing protein [Bacteroidales bacterium]
MKKLFTLSLLLSLCFPLFSQVYDQVFQSNPTEDALEIFEPGPLPEGDLIRVLAYSPDGNILAAMYQHSDNIYFYNTTTYALLSIVDMGREPMDITVTDQSAYVCCHTSNELYIINLSDFSISNTFEVYENPVQVEINPDETIVYVGCESASDGSVAAYNTKTGEEIFHTFEPRIYFNGRHPSLGRVSQKYLEFSLSPHSNYIVAMNTDDQAPALFDGSTGELVKKFNFGDMKGSGFSETGDTLYIFSTQFHESVSIHRIKLSDLSVIDSIVADWEDTNFGTNDIAINANGTKVLTVVSFFIGTYCLFDFEFYKYQFISDETMLFVNTRMFTSNDKKYGIFRGDGMAKFIELETGQVINRTPIGYPVGMAGAISPVADKMACGDGPHYQIKLYPDEKFYIFDIADPANIIVDTVIMSGIAPEADVTNCAVLSVDGSKLIASNMLTDNISIIDYFSGQLDTLIYMKGVSVVKTIPNTDFILAAGEDAFKTRIIDLRDNKIISELNTGYVKDVLITADGTYAYTFAANSTTTGTLTKISLDGESSEIVDVLLLGFKSCSYHDNNLRSKIALSPNGNFVLSVADDDSLGAVVHIVDTWLMEVVKTLPIEDGCVFDFVFTDDSKRVCILNHRQLPIINLNGKYSFIQSEVNIFYYAGLTGEYNPDDGLFYVLLQEDWLYKIDPVNGEIVDQIPTTSNTYVQLGFSRFGTPLMRGFSHLLFNDVVYPLPGVSLDFSFDRDRNLFVIPIPGPDKVCVFNPLTVEVKTYPETKKSVGIVLYPNPANGEVLISSEGIIENVKIYNAAGKLVFSKDCNKSKTSIALDNFEEGVYLLVTGNANGITTNKLIVVH